MTIPTTPDADTSTPTAITIDRVLAEQSLRTVFQPIVDLEDRSVVAYEALTRGPAGTTLESPAALFEAARAAGLLSDLDRRCRSGALTAALERGLLTPLHVFVNVEPEVLDLAPPTDLVAVAETEDRLQVVLEITERALAARPAELLATVDRVRQLGWRVALDDVGADPASLAFMEILRPDVVKLDLRLVQNRPSRAVAEIMNAVNAYAERSGALLLAEGIETEDHHLAAAALGARLGQGWLFGHPEASPQPGDRRGSRPLQLPNPPVEVRSRVTDSPFAALPIGTSLRVAPKKLLIELSKQLEREALRLGETCVVAAAFQESRHFTAATTRRYQRLAEHVGFVAALGDGLAQQPAEGVRGATLSTTDPVRGEWDITVLSPHYSAALLARDLGDTGPDHERRFEYALTYQRDVVVPAAQRLLARVVPEGGARPAEAGRTAATTWATGRSVPKAVGDLLVRRALNAATSGVTIADMTSEDHPLVYVNTAFVRLAGVPASQLVGHNCRFLQGPGTDPTAVARIRAAITAGRECRETLLNYRGPHQEPWWNEIHLSPVTDQTGTVVSYIGVQTDVTARVEAEESLRRETDLSRQYLARIEQLAYTDSLTGLLNRHRLHSELDTALAAARSSDKALALLFLDLDGFKQVNDAHGHAAGDELLQVVAARLEGSVASPHLVARLGGDEFLVALVDLDRDEVDVQVTAVADRLTALAAEPVPLRGRRVRVSASVGASTYPTDATTFEELLHLADQRMYGSKSRPLPARSAAS